MTDVLRKTGRRFRIRERGCEARDRLEYARSWDSESKNRARRMGRDHVVLGTLHREGRGEYLPSSPLWPEIYFRCSDMIRTIDAGTRGSSKDPARGDGMKRSPHTFSNFSVC